MGSHHQHRGTGNHRPRRSLSHQGTRRRLLLRSSERKNPRRISTPLPAGGRRRVQIGTHPGTRIKAGDIFLLFPGEWHTYHPSATKGWKSYWIGFKGKNIDDRVKAGFLSPEKPIYHVGFSNEILALYEEAYKTAQEEAAYSQQTLAGIVNHLIGTMYSLERNIVLNKNTQHVDLINKGRLRIRETLEEAVSIQDISQELGISYSSFRKLFKEYTGMAPAMYQQSLRLQRAKELLSTTDESIKEIAYRLNFESPDYFSAKFKNQTGMKPSDFRNMTR